MKFTQTTRTRKVLYKNSAGFTLVEILIVLAVIVILVAILVPVFTRVRERGYRATCQSNLHQIGLAMQQYVQDNNGSYPGETSRTSGWTVGLFPYLKNDTVYNCPTEENTDNAFENGVLIRGHRIDYGYNIGTFGELNKGKWFGANEAKPTALDTSLLAMIGDNSTDSAFVEELIAPCKDSPANESYFLSTLHSGGENDLFADGHVKWLTPQAAIADVCELREKFPQMFH